MAKILIIDDDASVRTMIFRMLVELGHEAVEASDGLNGMALVARERPDLVITDILMPEADGIETIRELRRMDPGVRIIAVSGSGCEGHASYLKAATAFGANAILAKPFRVDDLVQLIERVLAQHK